MKKLLAASALGAFVISGPMQVAGVLPVTAFGTASLSAIELALDLAVGEASACGNGNGNGNGNGAGKGNGKGGGRR